jgi:hypothetical protein
MVIGQSDSSLLRQAKQDHVQISLSACNFLSTTDTPSSGLDWTSNAFQSFYLPTDVQKNCFKENINIYIKAALTRFGAVTIIRERLIRAC